MAATRQNSSPRAAKKKSARKASPRKRKAVAAKKPAPVSQSAVTISVIMSDDVPVSYANFAEITHNDFDFGISFCRLPAKFTPREVDLIQEESRVETEPVFHVVLPHVMLPRLIQALQSQQALIEKQKENAT